jgi:hypothetical protein
MDVMKLDRLPRGTADTALSDESTIQLRPKHHNIDVAKMVCDKQEGTSGRGIPDVNRQAHDPG